MSIIFLSPFPTPLLLVVFNHCCSLHFPSLCLPIQSRKSSVISVASPLVHGDLDHIENTVGTGLFIQWINSEYMENKFKISSNTNSPIIFWICLKFILQFVSILFSAYIQNIVQWINWNQNVADTCQLPPAISSRLIYLAVRSERSKKGTMVMLCYTSVTPCPLKKSAWSSSHSPRELYGNPNKLILMCSC